MTRPMRFGVTAHTARNGRAWRKLARQAEELGYSSLLVPDHVNDQYAPLPALTAAAIVTRALRVGPLVLCNDFRHPALAAKDLATLDVLSEGRLEWGMGAGWFPGDFSTTGIAFDRAGVRVERLAETIDVMKALFAGEPVHLDGTHHHIDGLAGTPRPVQQPHPPLTIGASQRRLLSLAGRQADVVGIGPSMAARRFGDRPPQRSVTEATDEQIGWIRDAAGERFGDIELQMVCFPAEVTDDPAGAAARFAPMLGVDPDEALASPHLLVGPVESMVDTLEERRARWGVSYWVFPAAVMEQLAPVVEALADR